MFTVPGSATLGADGEKSKLFFANKDRYGRLYIKSPISFKADIINSDTNADKVRDNTKEKGN